MKNSKWLRRLLLLPLMMFGVSAVSFPADAPPTKESTAAPAKKTGAQSTKKTKKTTPRKFTGNISALDTKTGAVSVKGSSDEKNFMTKDAAKDALERLTVGDRVRVVYAEKDGKSVATSVRRLKLPQSKAKTTAQNAKSTTAGEQKQSKEKEKTKPGA
jgi:ribosomal protein S1